MLKKILIGLLFYCSWATHSQATVSSRLSHRLDQLVKTAAPNVNIGIMLQALSNHKIIYQYHPDAVFNPASTLKLFTAAAALQYLGPDYVFVTQLATNTQPVHGIISDDVFIKFSGDPLLTTANLTDLVKTLKLQGIHAIRGRLIIDATQLDNENSGPGWMWDEQTTCYAAPATAIVVDENCFNASLKPALHNNAVPTLELAPTLSGATLINATRSSTTSTLNCPLNLRVLTDNIYRLTGCIAPSSAELPLQIAIHNPFLATARILQTLFKQQQIQFAGTVVNGTMPSTAVILARHQSAPLSNLVQQMLKKSDNLMADIILKTLGAQYFHTTGTWTNGAAALRFILTPLTNIDFNQLSMVDGAGLSRYNLVSPRQFIKLLDYSYAALPSRTYFYAALPIMGIDGTLEKRLMQTTATGKIHAKTGTMTSTSALVGYAENKQLGTLDFAILINGFVANPDVYQQLEDQISKILVQ